MTTTLPLPGAAPPDAEPPDAEPLVSTPNRRRRMGTQLVIALVLLGTAFAGGAVLAFEPGQDAFDSWGFSVFSGILHSTFLGVVTDLGTAPAAAGVALVACGWTWRRNRRRAIACLAGPALAVGVAELLKVIVGRRLDHALCYPSGTTAVVAAVVTVLVLVTRRRGRLASFVIGSVVVIFEAIAVVKLRWHYPSDAVAGVLVGVGSVMAADTVLSWPRRPQAPDPG